MNNIRDFFVIRNLIQRRDFDVVMRLFLLVVHFFYYSYYSSEDGAIIRQFCQLSLRDKVSIYKNQFRSGITAFSSLIKSRGEIRIKILKLSIRQGRKKKINLRL